MIEYLLVFEILGVLLLIALIGAAMIARKEKA
jgi:NADH:ubiquinone oxidoreductase subunit 6 (subunit J)